MGKKLVGIGILVVVAILALFVSSMTPTALFTSQSESSIKIGWISDLTGSTAKYGSLVAAKIAVDEINAKGGINGKQIELIVEDGACNTKTALNAIHKLIDVDQVKFVLGGHCTPESVAIAPVVEENKVIMLASITTSPVLTPMGDYVFRTSPVGVVQSDLLSKIAVEEFNYKNIAIVFSQTDYARPIAERMQTGIKQLGANVVLYESFQQNTIDFHSLLVKVQQSKPDMIFVSSQNSDEAYQLLKQMKELNIKVAIFGNDQIYNTKAFGDSKLNEGVLTSGPAFDLNAPLTKEFVDKYNAAYHSSLPFGVWTAESYDAVHILANAISASGENPEKVKEYLYNVKDYKGASGSVTIDSNGDGVREYIVRIVKDGQLVPYELN